MIFYDNDYAFDLTQWEHFKRWNVLSIVIFFDIVWYPEGVRIETGKKNMSETCKDTENNRNDRNGVLPIIVLMF